MQKLIISQTKNAKYINNTLNKGYDIMWEHD